MDEDSSGDDNWDKIRDKKRVRLDPAEVKLVYESDEEEKKKKETQEETLGILDDDDDDVGEDSDAVAGAERKGESDDDEEGDESEDGEDDDDYEDDDEGGEEEGQQEHHTDDQGLKKEGDGGAQGTLNPLEMIDSQLGQQQSSAANQIFGSTGEDIFHQNKRRKKRGKGKSRGRRLPREIQNLIGDANRLFIEQKFDQAIQTCDEIIKRNPKLPDPYHVLTNIWYEKENLEKEFHALKWACDLDPKMKENNFIRLGELGLILGRNRKLAAAYDEQDVESDVEIPEEEDITGDDGEVVCYSRMHQKEFLETALHAFKKVLRKKFDINVALQKAEVYENMGHAQTAKRTYSRLLRSCFDSKTLDLTVIHQFARFYRLHNEPAKCENVLSKYVGAVLYPLPDSVATIELAASKASEQREKERMDKERRKKNRARLGKGGENPSDAGMALENLNSMKQTGRKRKNNIRKAPPPPIPGVAENGEEDDDMEEDEWDEEEKRNREIEMERQQLVSGIDILGMLVEILLEKKEFQEALGYLLRFTQFQKHGLCSIPEKNQWLFWAEIKPKLYVDLCQMLVICYIHMEDYQRARNYFNLIESLMDSVMSNARLLRLQAAIAHAWATKGKYVNALEVFESIMDFTDNLKFTLKLDIYSHAAHCCEKIDHVGEPVRAAATAGTKAIQYLNYLIDILDDLESRNPKKFAKLQVNRDSYVDRLSRMFTKTNETEKRQALLERFTRSESFRFRYVSTMDTTNQQVGPPPAPLPVSGGYGGGSFIVPSYFVNDSAISMSSGLRAQGQMASGMTTILYKPIAEIFDKVHQHYTQQEYYECIQIAVEYAKPFFDGKDSRFAKFKRKCLKQPSLDEISVQTRATITSSGTTSSATVSPATTKNQGKEKRGGKSKRIADENDDNDGDDDDDDDENDDDEEEDQNNANENTTSSNNNNNNNNTMLNPTEEERHQLNVVENDHTLRFIQEFTWALVHYTKGALAVEFLQNVLTHQKRVAKMDQYLFTDQLVQLMRTVCVTVHEFDIISKELVDMIRHYRDEIVERHGFEYVDDVAELWECLNGIHTCMKWDNATSKTLTICLRRVRRLLKKDKNSPNSENQSFAHIMVIANQGLMSHNYVRSLKDYFDARSLCPQSPLVMLCIVATYLNIIRAHKVEGERNGLVIKTFAHMQEYQMKRLPMANSDTERAALLCEIYCNFGRFAQRLGLDPLTELYYRKALSIPNASIYDKREVAFNASIYYESIGLHEMAKDLRKQYLTL